MPPLIGQLAAPSHGKLNPGIPPAHTFARLEIVRLIPRFGH